MIDKPAIIELSTKEKMSLTDISVKYYIITTVLDYLVISKNLTNRDNVPVSEVKEWLDKRSTYDYDWNTTCVKIELWLYEMIWLNLVSFDEKSKTMHITSHGFDSYKSQEFHLAYANLLNAKGSRRLTKFAFWASFAAAIASITTIVISLL